MAILVLTPQPARVRRLASELTEELVFAADADAIAERFNYPWSLTLVDEDFEPDAIRVIAEAARAQQRPILFTRNATLTNTVAALRAGAIDVLQLPIEPSRLRKMLEDENAEKAEWRSAVNTVADYVWVGSSPVLSEVFSLAGHAAADRTPVLITGESGTGKALLARMIHASGVYANEPYAGVNCSSIDDVILGVELFGGRRDLGDTLLNGQLTNSRYGTVFLDDLQNLPPVLQARLSGAIREHAFTPIGSPERRPLNARIVAATTVNLHHRAAKNEFSSDLLYQFKTEIVVPPLRRRVEDISLLAAAFMEEFAGLARTQVHGFEAATIEALEKYDWPGNVHQLRQAIEFAMRRARGRAIGVDDLPSYVTGVHDGTLDAPAERLTLESAERRHIRQVWRMTGGHLSDTANILGIHRNTLRRKLEQYGITEDDARL